MRRKKIQNILFQILKFSFAAGIFVWLAAAGKIDFLKIREALFHSPWILFSIAMGFGTLFMSAWRWWLLIRSQGIRFSFAKVFRLVLIGQFFNIIIPGTISGDIVKAYYITRNEEKKMIAGFSVLMDRLIGLFVLIGMTSAVVLVNASSLTTPELKTLGIGIVVLSMVSFLGILFFFLKSDFRLPSLVPSFFHRIAEVIWAYRRRRRILLKAAILTVFNYFFNVLLFYGVAQSLGENFLTFPQYLFLIPVGLFVMAIPIAPAGLGVGQGVFLKLFEWAYGRPVTIGADMVTLGQIVIAVWAMIGGILYFFHKQKKFVPMPEAGVMAS